MIPKINSTDVWSENTKTRILIDAQTTFRYAIRYTNGKIGYVKVEENDTLLNREDTFEWFELNDENIEKILVEFP